ncbi:MAG: hypothetical protein KR126chlam6_01065 [Candidatus Anoxychlamydiales bacterium]|nr:hypothetical protein [Candidatus Anoxychlamydiales bacterium]
MHPIRTISLIPVKIKITIEQVAPLYQKLAPKIRELKALGMTQDQIAIKLNVSIKTVRKSLNFNFSDIQQNHFY